MYKRQLRKPKELSHARLLFCRLSWKRGNGKDVGILWQTCQVGIQSSYRSSSEAESKIQRRPSRQFWIVYFKSFDENLNGLWSSKGRLRCFLSFYWSCDSWSRPPKQISRLALATSKDDHYPLAAFFGPVGSIHFCQRKLREQVWKSSILTQKLAILQEACLESTIGVGYLLGVEWPKTGIDPWYFCCLGGKESELSSNENWKNGHVNQNLSTGRLLRMSSSLLESWFPGNAQTINTRGSSLRKKAMQRLGSISRDYSRSRFRGFFSWFVLRIGDKGLSAEQSEPDNT